MGKILAEECEGTHFPKSFLIMLKTLEPPIAKLFQKLNDLKFSIITSNGEITENVLCINNNFPSNILSASELIQLENAGLIYQKDSSKLGFTFRGLEDKHCYILYHDKRINLQLDQNNSILFGTVIFTPNAELLSGIIEGNINEEYLSYLVKQLAEYNAELV